MSQRRYIPYHVTRVQQAMAVRETRATQRSLYGFLAPVGNSWQSFLGSALFHHWKHWTLKLLHFGYVVYLGYTVHKQPHKTVLGESLRCLWFLSGHGSRTHISGTYFLKIHLFPGSSAHPLAVNWQRKETLILHPPKINWERAGLWIYYLRGQVRLKEIHHSNHFSLFM